MQKYELMLMLFPDMGEKKTTEELSEVKSFIESLGGEIFHEDDWGNRELAYTIKKQDHGRYIVWNLKFPGANISELEQNFNINQSIMRYMMVKISDSYEYVPMEHYDQVAEQERLEKEKAKAERKKSRSSKPAPKKSAPKKAPAKKEATPKKASPELDDKLKNIISDPDISL